MKKYNSIQEVVAANKAIGNCFFEADTIRSFRSRVLQTLYAGRFFITSERHGENARKFTARMVVDGRIKTIGKFQQFKTKRSAANFIKSLPEQFPQAWEAVGHEWSAGKPSGMGVVSMALIEPTNSRDGGHSNDSFAGTLTWMMENSEMLDMITLRDFSKQYQERLNSTED